MKKSKLYKQIISGETTLKELFENNTVVLHRDKKTVEYVHFWNWNKKIKELHTEFSDYEIRALTFNGEVVCSGRVVTNDVKYNGFIRWFYPDKEDELKYSELMERFNDR